MVFILECVALTLGLCWLYLTAVLISLIVMYAQRKKKFVAAQQPRAVYTCTKHVKLVKVGQMAVFNDAKCYFCIPEKSGA